MITELRTGFVLINKPVGKTSFGCVTHVKRALSRKTKIGHAGTLDPFASGLLIVGIGREATRCMTKIMQLPKTYVVRAKFGELTDTHDHTGTIIQIDSVECTQKELENALASFGSSYEQTPPIYSALKHEGEPLYKLARHQLRDAQELTTIAESKKKIVQLYDVQILDFSYPFFTLQVTVSQGTYIRSFVYDVAQKLSTIATTYALERTAIGQFTVQDAYTLEQLSDIGAIDRALIPVDHL